MPDDPILGPAGANQGQPAQTPAPAPAGPTTEQVAQMIGSALKDALTPFVTRLNDLSDRLAAPRATEPSPEPRDNDGILSQLPGLKEAIESIASNAVSSQIKTLGPFLSDLTHSAQNAFVDIEAQNINRQFGEGAWEKLVAGPWAEIQAHYSKVNPAALANSQVIRREINGIKGALFDKLAEFRTESAKSREAGELKELDTFVQGIADNVVQRTNLTGGVRRIPGADPYVVDDAVKGYLAERKNALGEEVDPKQWLKETDFGNTLSDFLAHQEKLAAKPNGSPAPTQGGNP